jgi:nitrilase
MEGYSSSSQPSSQPEPRVAVTQAEPARLDLEGTVEKTCALVTEAAENGVQVIAFLECCIPGYPAWIWYPLPPDE